MLAKYPLSIDATDAQSQARLKAPTDVASGGVTLPDASVAELVHLARAVLMKSPDDLAAIANSAPSMPSNWIEAFAAERARAEAEAKFWSTAIAYLIATSPTGIANDG